jgi:hypothetical protein
MVNEKFVTRRDVRQGEHTSLRAGREEAKEKSDDRGMTVIATRKGCMSPHQTCKQQATGRRQQATGKKATGNRQKGNRQAADRQQAYSRHAAWQRAAFFVKIWVLWYAVLCWSASFGMLELCWQV